MDVVSLGRPGLTGDSLNACEHVRRAVLTRARLEGIVSWGEKQLACETQSHLKVEGNCGGSESVEAAPVSHIAA